MPRARSTQRTARGSRRASRSSPSTPQRYVSATATLAEFLGASVAAHGGLRRAAAALGVPYSTLAKLGEGSIQGHRRAARECVRRVCGGHPGRTHRCRRAARVGSRSPRRAGARRVRLGRALQALSRPHGRASRPIFPPVAHLSPAKQRQLRAITTLLRIAANVERVLLFGSHARGDWRDEPGDGRTRATSMCSHWSPVQP